MSSAADKYVEARAEGQSKLEASVRAVGTGMISYFSEALGGIGGSKSPLGKLEEKAGEKLITSILYNAFEEGGEEFVEYAADFLLDGAADMVFKGEWQQEWSWEEVIENAKIGAMTGGLFGGYQKLMNKIYTGNPEVDAQLDRAAKAYSEYMKDAYRLQSDPELRAIAERQIGETTIPYALRRAYKGVSASGEAAAELTANVEVFSEAQQRWNAQLKSGGESKARAPRGVARSITAAELDTDAAKEAGAKAIDMKRHFSQKQRTAIAFARELAKVYDINIVFYQTEGGKGANGWYDRESDTIYIDLFSGFKNEQAMLRTLSHELTHFIEKYSPEHYEGFKNFLLDYYYGKDEGATLERLIENERKLAPNQSREYWENEVVANASEMFVKDEGAMRALIGEHADIAKSVDQWFSKMNYALRRAYKGVSASGEAAAELAANVEVFSEAQQRWNALLKESVEAKKAVQGAGENSGAQFSIRNIVGESGKNYGKGVYLDSNLLENLSDSERIEMVKMRIRELGGQTFTAYDGNTPVEIKIENSKTRFTNKNGRFVQVNRDLTTKNINRQIKQETVVLADEMISSSAYKESVASRYSHGWLDNKGQGEWERRTVFVQEKNNSVWEATLHIANTKNGEKILYDIDPIKIVERRVKSRTNTTDVNIHSSEEKVNTQFSKRAEKFSQLDSEYAKAVESNDTETAEKLVEEAARAAGYNSPLLYHGTQSFGFTKLDVSKSDDGISFFSTTNPDMAQTYSGEYGKRAIGRFSDRDISALSPEQVVARLNDRGASSKYPRKYYLMDRADVTKLESKIHFIKNIASARLLC